MAYSYENELNALKNAQKQAAVADLQNTRNESLSNLEAERRSNAANYNNQRNTANVQSRLGAKNFQEYLASTGRANSGLASQAKLQNNNNLNTSLNSINSAENATNADISRRITNANNAYNSGLTSANANIEANYINNLLDQRQKALANELAEKQYQESVRQFNEQMAYNYKQLYSNFNKGGSSKKKSEQEIDETEFTDTPENDSGNVKSGITTLPGIKYSTTSNSNSKNNNKKQDNKKKSNSLLKSIRNLMLIG